MHSTDPAAAESQAILVLGGTGGIGSELCRQLVAAGARVAVASRDEARARATAEPLGAFAVHFDPTDFPSVESAMKSVRDHFGRLDGVANCVGSVVLKPAHLTRQEEWNEVVSVNLGTAFAVVRGAARAMPRGGSVVFVSSAAASLGLSSHEAIAAAKAGIEGLTRSAAATYAARNLRFNAVAPGLVRTPSTERITTSEAASKTSIAMHALGRLGEPEDVASAIRWLLDPAQSWITGQVLGVDGGLSSVRSNPKTS